MTAPAITIDRVSKRYRLGIGGGVDRTLRDALADGWSKLIGRQREAISDVRELWALRDVSFDIQPGEAVGIIGSNGAGKSTLLKVLSQITEPTHGQISIRGRVASLLEVGTGFHPELSGRENIFLNGAILGMSRREVRAKFDEIVAFSGVEKFLDTPVKRYSSGMRVRLAFAVAAHLEPEILIVDEVLAVGDAEFQRRCLGKMREVTSSQGRTVLFVSHNMAAVQRLCSRVLVFDQGRMICDNAPSPAIEAYVQRSAGEVCTRNDLASVPRGSDCGNGRARFTSCVLRNMNGKPTRNLRYGEPFTIDLEAKSFDTNDEMWLIAGIDSIQAGRVTTAVSIQEGVIYRANQGERFSGRVTFTELNLKPGFYTLTFCIRSNQTLLDMVQDVISFHVSEVSIDGGRPHIPSFGVVTVPTLWSNGIKQLNAA